MPKRSARFGLVLLWVLWAGMSFAHAQFLEYLRPSGATYGVTTPLCATSLRIQIFACGPARASAMGITIIPSRISRDGSTVIGNVTGSGRTETGFSERIGGASGVALGASWLLEVQGAPVPEPATMVVLASGLALLSARSRTRRKV